MELGKKRRRIGGSNAEKKEREEQVEDKDDEEEEQRQCVRTRSAIGDMHWTGGEKRGPIPRRAAARLPYAHQFFRARAACRTTSFFSVVRLVDILVYHFTQAVRVGS